MPSGRDKTMGKGSEALGASSDGNPIWLAMRASKVIRALTLILIISFVGVVTGTAFDDAGQIQLGNWIAEPGAVAFLPAAVGLTAAIAGWKTLDERNEPWWILVLAGGALISFCLLPAFLLFLVTNGNGSNAWTFLDWYIKGSGIFTPIEFFLTSLVIGLVIGLPAFLRRTDGWGNSPQPEKEIVLRWFAIAASLATGLYVFLLDFIVPHARRIPPGQFSVAILFAVLLLLPVYKSLARTCSTLGIVGICDPVRFWNNERKGAQVLKGAFASWFEGLSASSNKNGNDIEQSSDDA
jgi:hypothetical protein